MDKVHTPITTQQKMSVYAINWIPTVQIVGVNGTLKRFAILDFNNAERVWHSLHQHPCRSHSVHPCYTLRLTGWDRPCQRGRFIQTSALNSEVISKQITVIPNTHRAHHNDNHSWVSVFCPNQHTSMSSSYCRAVWMLTVAGAAYLGDRVAESKMWQLTAKALIESNDHALARCVVCYCSGPSSPSQSSLCTSRTPELKPISSKSSGTA
jgi:hypothetical protein